MPNGRARVAAIGMSALLVGATGHFEARTSSEPPLVLHVDDYAGVPAPQLAEAQKVVNQVYAAASVRLVWTDGHARTAAVDEAFHLDVVVLSTNTSWTSDVDLAVLGSANHLARRAYIVYPRVVAYALRTVSPTARVLAYALAHEIGHVVLPGGHTPRGLMRSSLHGPVGQVPLFTTGQGARIRARLTASPSNPLPPNPRSGNSELCGVLIER